MPGAFRSLRSFCLVVKNGSIKNTALELHMTSSAISHQIANLEQHLGKQLFERKTRRIVPTDDALMLYEEVEPLLNKIESLISKTAQQ